MASSESIVESRSDVPPICRSPPYLQSSSAREVYRVPRRFGLLAVMTLLTAYSLLFAGLRILEAPPLVFVGLGTFGIIVSGLQMSFGTVPRAASFAAGACLLPLTVILTIFLRGDLRSVAGTVASLPVLVVVGGIFGYLVGTLVAGVFLILDYWEQWLMPGRSKHPPD
jgi:hypothetical protein